MNVFSQLFSLEGKTALVTGGAQGIGKVVAGYLAAAGANIAILDLQEEKAQQTATELATEYGIKTAAFAVDVTNETQVAKTIQVAALQLGELDLLFNNAGIVLHKPALDVTAQEWTKVIDVNLNGVFIVAQAFARYLVSNNRKGSIVNTASMSANIVNYPQPQASYNTSKAGVVHMTKSLAVEWAPYGIRVNCISPGYIFTELTCHVNQEWQDYWVEQTPFRRMGKPEELAGAVIYLLSNAASFTSGSELIIDGCFTAI